MITKERLKELIEQEATIYDSGIVDVIEIKLKNDDWVEENGVLYKKNNMFGGFRYFYDEKLFETKEDAEWHKEFGCIERTERLDLPTWEEFDSVRFYTDSAEVILYKEQTTIEDKEYSELIVIWVLKFGGRGDCVFREYSTKENYTLACRKAKELFLGEKK